MKDSMNNSASPVEKKRILAALQSLVDAGYPAALATVRDPQGNTTNAVAGTGNLETGEAPPLDGEVRAGSNTKTFVAVVLMQLVQEGKITLDEPIETGVLWVLWTLLKNGISRLLSGVGSILGGRGWGFGTLTPSEVVSDCNVTRSRLSHPL